MRHVSSYNSHLQAKLRTVNALQGGCSHLGSHMAYSVFAVFFSLHKVIYLHYGITGDRLCGLVVRVSGYRYRGPGFDPRRYQIFWVVVGL